MTELPWVAAWLLIVALVIAATGYFVALYRGVATPEGRERALRFQRRARRIVIVGIVAYGVFVVLVALGVLPGPAM